MKKLNFKYCTLEDSYYASSNVYDFEVDILNKTFYLSCVPKSGTLELVKYYSFNCLNDAFKKALELDLQTSKHNPMKGFRKNNIMIVFSKCSVFYCIDKYELGKHVSSLPFTTAEEAFKYFNQLKRSI